MRQGKHITPQLLEQPASVELLRGVDTLVLDCDGVLWEGNDIIQGSVESLLKLRLVPEQIESMLAVLMIFVRL